MLAPTRARLALLSFTLLALAVTSTSSASIPSASSATASSHHHSPDPVKTPPTHKAPSDSQLLLDQWSSIVGWISIACWILPAFSQLRENYVRKSGEGLSLAFLFIWFAGDALNLIGAWRQELLWTMIVLAFYYTACDVALIGQYYYYQYYAEYFDQRRQEEQEREEELASTRAATETSPLISRGGSGDADKTDEAPSTLTTFRNDILPYLVAVGFVVGTGVAAWFVEQYNARHPPQGPISPPLDQDGTGWKWDAQISGWLSAALYLCSRVPQIFKNRQTKCEGLSLALFLFAVAGNTTYIASIMIKSLDRDYLVRNMSWLVGSVGTVGLDFIVLGQFVHYKKEREQLESRQRRSSVSGGGDSSLSRTA